MGTTPGTLECRNLPLPASTTKREVQDPTGSRPSPAVLPSVSAASRLRPRLAESGAPGAGQVRERTRGAAAHAGL